MWRSSLIKYADHLQCVLFIALELTFLGDFRRDSLYCFPCAIVGRFALYFLLFAPFQSAAQYAIVPCAYNRLGKHILAKSPYKLLIPWTHLPYTSLYFAIFTRNLKMPVGF